MKPFSKLIAATAVLALTAFSAAQARAVAVAVAGDGARVELHDHVGPCVGAARWAEYVSSDGENKIPGCWTIDEQMVRVSFFDGERGDIPLARLKPVSDNGPVTPPARSASRADSV